MATIKAIDLFSGCGGVSCGLTRAGFSVKAAVEIEKAAVKTYLNYPPLANVNVLQKDIHMVSGSELLKAAKIHKNELYLLAGCPPCQNFSIQNPKNKYKSESERRELLFEFLRIIEEIHPPFILMENVPGIATRTNANILSEFIWHLENGGVNDKKIYYVIKKVLNAADYGVPQARKRFVLHAVRMDIYERLNAKNTLFMLPEATHNEKGSDGLKKWVTVKEAIDDLPKLKAGQEYKGKKTIYNHRCANLSETNIARMKFIRSHGGSRVSLPESMTLDCHKKKNNNGEPFGGHKDVYGIMDPNKPSPTITGGCLCYTKGRFGHYSQNRAISIREAARIQTFPDDFVFDDSLSQAALQIGNAVPVKLVEASANEFAKAISALRKS